MFRQLCIAGSGFGAPNSDLASVPNIELCIVPIEPCSLHSRLHSKLQRFGTQRQRHQVDVAEVFAARDMERDHVPLSFCQQRFGQWSELDGDYAAFLLASVSAEARQDVDCLTDVAFSVVELEDVDTASSTDAGKQQPRTSSGALPTE